MWNNPDIDQLVCPVMYYLFSVKENKTEDFQSRHSRGHHFNSPGMKNISLQFSGKMKKVFLVTI